MIIETERCLLKTASAKEVILAMQNRRMLLELLGVKADRDWPPEAFISGFEHIIRGIESEDLISQSSGSPWWLWWIIIKPSQSSDLVGRIIGHIGFKGRPSIKKEIELTYAICKSYQKMGFGYEVARALINCTMKQKSVNSIIADTHPTNTASQKLLIKLGFLQSQNQKEGDEDILFKLNKVS